MNPVQYKFTNLSEISVNEIVNVIAVVKFFQKPKKTKGSGFQMTISITDPSLGYDDKLTCSIFNDKAENLPRISSRGDVIVFHRLKIDTYKDKLQGSGNHKSGLASAVICRDDSDKLLNGSFDDVSEILKFDSASFNITTIDYEKVREMMLWANDMPQSQDGEFLEEIDICKLHFSTLSVLEVEETVSLAVQIISIITVDDPLYRSLILVWDATKPGYDLNKKFITILTQATSLKHSINLMAKFGGKLSHPYITCILFKDTPIELRDSFVKPGDLIYLGRVLIRSATNGPGVLLIGEQCRIGALPQEYPLYEELIGRLSLFSRHTPCVADCISKDIGTLESFHLHDYSKLLYEISGQTENLKESYCFKLSAKVAKVHPSNEKEFLEAVLQYCLSCERIKEEGGVAGPDRCVCVSGVAVPVPMVTVVVEDFTGWLTVVMIGRTVMNLMSLVMIEATKSQWWAQLDLATDVRSIHAWLAHINRLKEGWLEGKLVFRRARHGRVLPFVEEVVVLDY